MLLQDIEAKDLSLGDDLGEGMRIWMISKNNSEPRITVWWSSRPGCSLYSATPRELMQQLKAYYSNDPVRVMRRCDDQHEKSLHGG